MMITRLVSDVAEPENGVITGGIKLRDFDSTTTVVLRYDVFVLPSLLSLPLQRMKMPTVLNFGFDTLSPCLILFFYINENFRHHFVFPSIIVLVCWLGKFEGDAPITTKTGQKARVRPTLSISADRRRRTFVQLSFELPYIYCVDSCIPVGAFQL